MALVEVARFVDLSEAQVAASALRAQGVEVFVQNEHWGQAEPYMQLAIGGFRLWAPEEDAAHARAFIDERRSAPAAITGSVGQTVAAVGLLFVLGPLGAYLAKYLGRRRPVAPDGDLT